MRVDRQIRTSARAKAAKTAPCTTPATVRVMNCCTRSCLPSWSEAEVGVPEVLVAHEGAGRVCDDDAAEVEDDADVGDREGAAGVLLDEQHGQALGVDQLADQAEDLRHDPRGQP